MDGTTRTFHGFHKLPAELRLQIWELSVEPRVVEAYVKLDRQHYRKDINPISGSHIRNHRPQIRYLCSNTPAPAQLQSCHEARVHLSNHHDVRYKYTKGFQEIGNTSADYDVEKRHSGYQAIPGDSPKAKRYAWYNFEIDMLCIGQHDVAPFVAVSHQIHRLRVVRDVNQSFWYYSESHVIFGNFTNLREFHLVSLGGLWAGEELYEQMEPWCLKDCPAEQVWLINHKIGGKMMNLAEVVAIEAANQEEFQKFSAEGREDEFRRWDIEYREQDHLEPRYIPNP